MRLEEALGRGLFPIASLCTDALPTWLGKGGEIAGTQPGSVKPLGGLILGSIKVEGKGVPAFFPPFANLEFETPKVIGFSDGIGSEKLKYLGLGASLSTPGGLVGDAFIGC